ncbi:MAG: hypothetical protein DHS20C11_05380 [Lysobacteraceae bacterium]|nr:MAG: hypothetical protein DHS20C11_05380 [Xanthomonadaceae bacterium]
MIRHALTACVLLLSVPANAQMSGDSEALERVELMVERLGGAAVWSRTRTLYLVYDAWSLDPAQPVVEYAWRDLTEPREHMRYQRRTGSFERVFDGSAGWHKRDSVRRDLSAEEVEQSNEFWPRDFYTMIRRLAIKDSDLVLRWQQPNKVYVDDQGGTALGWWVIDDTGQPVIWGTMYDNEPLEYLYMPVVSYGVINFPEGGTAVDGGWRFTYRKVDVSDDKYQLPEVD